MRKIMIVCVVLALLVAGCARAPAEGAAIGEVMPVPETGDEGGAETIGEKGMPVPGKPVDEMIVVEQE